MSTHLERLKIGKEDQITFKNLIEKAGFYSVDEVLRTFIQEVNKNKIDLFKFMVQKYESPNMTEMSIREVHQKMEACINQLEKLYRESPSHTLKRIQVFLEPLKGNSDG